MFEKIRGSSIGDARQFAQANIFAIIFLDGILAKSIGFGIIHLFASFAISGGLLSLIVWLEIIVAGYLLNKTGQKSTLATLTSMLVVGLVGRFFIGMEIDLLDDMAKSIMYLGLEQNAEHYPLQDIFKFVGTIVLASFVLVQNELDVLFGNLKLTFSKLRSDSDDVDIRGIWLDSWPDYGTTFIAIVAWPVLFLLAPILPFEAKSVSLLVMGGVVFVCWLMLTFEPGSLLRLDRESLMKLGLGLTAYLGLVIADGMRLIPVEPATILILALIGLTGYWSSHLNRGSFSPRITEYRSSALTFSIILPFVLFFVFQLMVLLRTDSSWNFDLSFMENQGGFVVTNVWPYLLDPGEWIFSQLESFKGVTILGERYITGNSPGWNLYRAGVIASVRVTIYIIILATVLGTIVGVLRLSNNKLASGLATAFVEFFRNMPLVVLLYMSVIVFGKSMPLLSTERNLFGLIYYSNRAVYIPSLVLENLSLLILAIIIYFVARRITKHLDADGFDDSNTGLMRRLGFWSGITLVLVMVLFNPLSSILGSILEPLGQSAFSTSIPEIDKYRGSDVIRPSGAWIYVGGMVITPQFLTLMIGITLYSSALIAEIVRGSIQALDRGQVEAAISLALTPFQRLRLVILPQALRSMIPLMTNQYLNIWKNSSLALVVGYSDFFSVLWTIVNKEGQGVPVFIIILLTYQFGSLFMSAIMNSYNRKVTKVRI
jgi:general L-amino acid transport system permease protein